MLILLCIHLSDPTDMVMQVQISTKFSEHLYQVVTNWPMRNPGSSLVDDEVVEATVSFQASYAASSSSSLSITNIQSLGKLEIPPQLHQRLKVYHCVTRRTSKSSVGLDFLLVFSPLLTASLSVLVQNIQVCRCIFIGLCFSSRIKLYEWFEIATSGRLQSRRS